MKHVSTAHNTHITHKSHNTMKTQNTTDLRNNTLSTVSAFDEENVIGSHFVGWQEGFEHSYIEVQFCDQIDVSAEDAMEIAEERMRELNRGQNNESDFVVTRLV